MQVIRFIETNTNKFIGYLSFNLRQEPQYVVSEGLQELDWEHEVASIEDFKNTTRNLRHYSTEAEILRALIRARKSKVTPIHGVTFQLLDVDTSDITAVKSSVVKQFEMIITSERDGVDDFSYKVIFPETGVSRVIE